MKKCSRCQKEVSISLFHRGSNGGYSSYCKPCAAKYNKEKVKRKLKRLYKDSKSRQCRSCEIIKRNDEMSVGYMCKSCTSHNAFVRSIGKKYNMTYEEYKALHTKQNHLCAICGKKEKLCIDHDHNCCFGPSSCGKCIRGLVCFKCNVALGMVKDNPEVLKKMVLYLDHQNY